MKQETTARKQEAREKHREEKKMPIIPIAEREEKELFAPWIEQSDRKIPLGAPGHQFLRANSQTRGQVEEGDEAFLD